jgi:hypothetical protein
MSAHNKTTIIKQKSSNVDNPYFGSIIAIQRLDWVVRIVGAHEEPHPVKITENHTLDNLAVVTAVAHRNVDPLWHHNFFLPCSEQLQLQLWT